jgi:methyl-accepting chemotaxis protein
MVSSIDKMAENLQRQTQDGVTNLVKQFTDNLHGSAGREMEAITTALAGLEGTLEATIGRLNQSGGDFGSKLDSVAQRMDLLMANAAEKLTGSVDGSTDRLESILGDIANQLRNQMEAVGVSLRAMTEESAGALGAGAKNAADSLKATMGSAGIELSDRFRTISGRLEETLGPLAATLGSVEGSLRTLDSRLSGQFAEIERMLVRTRDLIASFDGSAERLRDAGAPIASTADKFTLAAGRIDATAGIIGQAHEQIENLTESLTQTSDRLRDSSKLYQQGTTEIDEKLGRIFSAMHDATDQYHRSISEFVTKLDGQFSSSTRLLQGGIEDLGSVVSELRDATEALKPNGRG